MPKKWRVDLIGVPFHVYTDHKILVNFSTQKDLSPGQARWQELLSQYDLDITYIAGVDNGPADAMSRILVPYVSAGSVGVTCVAKHPLIPMVAEPSRFCATRIGAARTLAVYSASVWAKDNQRAYGDDWFTRCSAILLWDVHTRALTGPAGTHLSALDALKAGLLDGRSFVPSTGYCFCLVALSNIEQHTFMNGPSDQPMTLCVTTVSSSLMQQFGPVIIGLTCIRKSNNSMFPLANNVNVKKQPVSTCGSLTSSPSP